MHLLDSFGSHEKELIFDLMNKNIFRTIYKSNDNFWHQSIQYLKHDWENRPLNGVKNIKIILGNNIWIH